MKVAITWKKVWILAWKSKPGFWNRARIFDPGWKAEKPHVLIAAKFQPRFKSEFEKAHWQYIQQNKMAAMEKLCFTRAETRHVIATKFQPGEQAGISAWAEIRHVITP